MVVAREKDITEKGGILQINGRERIPVLAVFTPLG
jgi:hypothetical protein